MSGPVEPEAKERPMESRVVRNNQPGSWPCREIGSKTAATNLSAHTGYNTNGVRLVAGVVPLSRDRKYVLLIQSTRRKGWVLPKGGWESDESCQEAATREAWEEAGVSVEINVDLG
ncbi:hypothetical protein Golomagni_08047, partial [Golovinomyces magnicellulatus]